MAIIKLTRLIASMNNPLKTFCLIQKLPCLILLSLLCSCATTKTTGSGTPDDWEGLNRNIQAFNDKVDSLVTKPVAEAYLWTTPEVVDTGVTNFFNNIEDIGVTLNDFLQFKLLDGGLDFTRFLVNSTVGIAGIIDVGTMLSLPKHEEDFDQTLGVWGVPTGPYLVLPFIGPSSPRGIFGLIGDAAFNPLTYTFLLGGGAVSVASTGSGILDATDTRAGLLTSEKIVNEAAIDRYEFIKSAYRQRRNYLEHDGKVPEEDQDYLLDEDIDKPSK
ncbi:MAG: VacJ family lipoprotein [Methylococcales bacterium]